MKRTMDDVMQRLLIMMMGKVSALLTSTPLMTFAMALATDLAKVKRRPDIHSTDLCLDMDNQHSLDKAVEVVVPQPNQLIASMTLRLVLLP